MKQKTLLFGLIFTILLFFQAALVLLATDEIWFFFASHFYGFLWMQAAVTLFLLWRLWDFVMLWPRSVILGEQPNESFG